MTDRQFIEEVRARTGEPVYVIKRTINFIYNAITHKEVRPLNQVYEDMIMIMDKEYCASSLSLANKLFNSK